MLARKLQEFSVDCVAHLIVREGGIERSFRILVKRLIRHYAHLW